MYSDRSPVYWIYFILLKFDIFKKKFLIFYHFKVHHNKIIFYNFYDNIIIQIKQLLIYNMHISSSSFARTNNNYISEKNMELNRPTEHKSHNADPAHRRLSRRWKLHIGKAINNSWRELFRQRTAIQYRPPDIWRCSVLPSSGEIAARDFRSAWPDVAHTRAFATMCLIIQVMSEVVQVFCDIATFRGVYYNQVMEI